MRNLVATICLFSLVAFGVAVAQQDVMCVCTDSESYSSCGGNVDVDMYHTQNLYLLITNPSAYQVSAWEAQVEIVTTVTYFGDWEVLGGGLNIGYGSNYIVGLGASPMHPNADGSMVLLQIALTVIDTSAPINIHVRRVPDSSSYPDSPGYFPEAGFSIPCVTCSGDPDIPVFTINGEDPPPSFPQFSVELSAHVDNLDDNGNIAGAITNATDIYDPPFEAPEPPKQPSEYVTLYFPHPEWASPLGDRFMTDYREPYNPLDNLKVWSFEVLTDRSQQMTLDFAPDDLFDDGWGLYLHDPVDDWTVDVRMIGYSFNYMPTPGIPRTLELWVGPPGMVGPEPQSRDLPAGWSLAGLPMIPPSPGTISQAFLQNAAWSTFIYDHDPGNGYRLLELGDAADLLKAYWIGATQAYTWDIPGGTLNTSEVNVPLTPGWNMVSYPLWISTDLDGVMVTRSGYDIRTWGEAVSAGWVSAFPFGYDSASESYVDAVTFDTWYGYWVACHDSYIQLKFNYATVIPPGTTPKTDDFDSPDAWRLAFSVDGRSEGVSLGFNSQARESFDARYDLPEPPASPVPRSAAKLRFEHPEWDLAVGSSFLTDIRAPIEEPYDWTATLTAPEPGPVVLNWDSTALPDKTDPQIYLPHQNRVVVMSMQDESSVVLEVGDEPLLVTFRSPDALTAAPDRPVAHAITSHPNPFNPSTEIKLTSSLPGRLGLEIYDLRGRRVRAFDLGTQTAGTYTETWRGLDDTGRELAGGTYFAVLLLDGVRTDTMAKLTLVK